MPELQKSAAELLATPVQFLKGVGPQRAEVLQRIGLHTARDVLFYFPRDYQDLADLNSLDELEENKLVRLRGVVIENEMRGGRSGKSVLGVLVQCGRGNIRAMWFNQPYMRDRLPVGQHILLSGKARFRGGIWEMAHPGVQWIEEEEESDTSRPAATLLPIYSLTEGLSQGHVRKIVRSVLETSLAAIDEVFPAEYLAAHDLWPIHEALPQIHFPDTRETLARARRRFVYQELFILQLALAVRHHQQYEGRQAPPLEATAKIDARIRRLFPFEFTSGQEQAIAELKADMARPHPMNRLLQGEVGSGKTVVALYAVLLAVAHGYQGAIMAPTEILARQHADTLGKILSSSRVRWSLLTGGISAKERQQTLDALRAGELDVVIGTQAIVQADVEFARLGVVVIDEQHKFGVRQRATLKLAGLDPHYLVMTATPIPRTVAMTVFGDLDISVMRDAPPGRQPVNTYLAEPEQREKWWDFFGRKLREGRQGYVIAPLVESSGDDEAAMFGDDAADAAPLPSAEQLYESLANGSLEAFRVGLVHGRMSAREKDAVMADFRSGKLQVLVATTVIEVGVDVPNATLLTIEGGERFGLSQLHQLRGRVSRGTHPGFCCVFAEPKTDESRRRLEAFVASTDGFQLAEVDFELRGPGDLLGTRQHGLPPLRIADLRRDQPVVEETRHDARSVIEQDPGLAQPPHERLRRMMLVRYGQVLDLGDVG